MDVESRHEAGLSQLRAAPVGPRPAPPVQTLVQELPLRELTWENFEKLVERLVELEGAQVEYVSRYGTAGEDQSGIDIYCRLADGAGYVVYQCKRYATLTQSVIRAAVSEFLDNKWAEPGDSFAQQFVLCTSDSLVPSRVADELEVQAKRLKEHTEPVRLDAWGRERLSKKLKLHPELVEDFFGPGWVAAFCPGGATQSNSAPPVSGRDAEVEDALQSSGAEQRLSFLSILTGGAELLKRTIAELARTEPSALSQLRALVGDPPEQRLVVKSIDEPSSWLLSAPGLAWAGLALMAEEFGEWEKSSVAWVLAAEAATDDYDAASYLTSAAVSSHLADDETQRQALLARAKAMYPLHPRVALEDAQKLQQPADQLAALEGLELRDPLDIALVEAQRAMAWMVTPDLARAEEHAAKAKAALPGSAIAEALDVNIAVQRGRLNLVEGRNQNAANLRDAQLRALTLRGAMLKQRRYREAAGLLMLACDAMCLQGAFSDAHEALGQVTSGELSAEDSAEVLGHAAIRAFAHKEALRLTEAAPKTDGVRFIRASATLDLPTASVPQVKEAVSELDQLVAERGLYSTEAAFGRLMYAMQHGDWSADAEAVLREGGHERPALGLRAFYLGRRGDWEGAWALYDGLDDRVWAAPTRLRIARQWGRESNLKEAADAVMASGPGQSLKFECGEAYVAVREHSRAREIFADVAGDSNAPLLLRANAYSRLVSLLGPVFNDWDTAASAHERWQQLAPSDPRAQQWAPTIASRQRAASAKA